MVDIPMGWRVTNSGVDSVKARFKELHDEFKTGKISLEDYTKRSRELKQELNAMTDNVRINRRAFEAAHPNLMAFGRAMSGVTSVMHAASTAMNAINIAQLLSVTTNSQLAEANQDVEKAQRAYNDAVRQFGADSPQAKDAMSDLNIEMTKQKELMTSQGGQWINNVLTLGTNIAFVGSAAATAAPKIRLAVAGMAGIPLAAAGGIGALAGLANGIAMIGSVSTIFDKIMGTKMFDWLSKNLDDLFAGKVPQLLSLAGLAFQHLFTFIIPNAAIDMMNVLNEAIESVVNLIIGAVNGVIKGINKLNIPGISFKTIASYAAPKLPNIAAAQVAQSAAAATSGITESAQQGGMLVSAGGSFKGAYGAPAGGSTTTIINNIAGSVVVDKQLYSTNAKLQQQELLRRGFRSV